MIYYPLVHNVTRQWVKFGYLCPYTNIRLSFALCTSCEKDKMEWFKGIKCLFRPSNIFTNTITEAKNDFDYHLKRCEKCRECSKKNGPDDDRCDEGLLIFDKLRVACDNMILKNF